MILSPVPSWLPALCQPADWLIAQVLGILIAIGLFVLFAIPNKGGEENARL